MPRFYKATLAAGLGLLASIAATAQTRGIPAQDRDHLLIRDQFSAIDKTASLPPAIQSLLAGSLGVKPLETAMADPGKPWDAGCVRTGLPAQRLVFAAVAKDHCIVVYETGGFAGGARHVRLYQLNEADGRQTAVLAWSGSANSGEVSTLEALRVAVRYNVLADEASSDPARPAEKP